MTNEELKNKLKTLIFEESRDEQESPEDGLKVGLLSNTELYDEIESIMMYYKNISIPIEIKLFS